jgi:hypothetical protein
MIETHQAPNLMVIVIDDPKSIQRFKELVQRATNLWPDAPASIKEFADIVTNNGVILQDYRGQDTSPKN